MPHDAQKTALETRLRTQPEDSEAWLVYADLLGVEAPLAGELIVIEHELRTQPLAAVPALAQGRLDLRRRVLGPRVFAAVEEGDIEILWQDGVIRSVAFQTKETDLVAALLDNPAARLVSELGFRAWSFDDGSLVRLLATAGRHRASTIERLFIQAALLGSGMNALAEAALLRHVTELDLSEVREGQGDVSALFSSPNVRGLRKLRLWLPADRVGTDVTKLAEGDYLSSLESLHLWNTGYTRGAQPLAPLLSSTKLTALRELSVPFLSVDDLAEARGLPALEALAVGGLQGGDMALAALVDAPTVAGLQSLALRLDPCDDLFSEQDLEQLGHLSNLEALRLHTHAEADANWLVVAPMLRRLRELRLPRMPPASFLTLVRARALANLRSLSVWGVSLDAATVEALVDADILSSLEHLDVGSSYGTDPDRSVSAWLASATPAHLRELSGCLGPRTAAAIASVELPSLVALSLVDISDSDLGGLTYSPFLAQIERLYLDRCAITEAGLGLLGRSAPRRLRLLDLSDNPLTLDAIVTATFSALASLTTVRVGSIAWRVPRPVTGPYLAVHHWSDSLADQWVFDAGDKEDLEYRHMGEDRDEQEGWFRYPDPAPELRARDHQRLVDGRTRRPTAAQFRGHRRLHSHREKDTP